MKRLVLPASLSFLVVFAMASVATVRSQTPAPTATSPTGPTVATAAGRLRGLKLQSPNVNLFKGIHYGESTAGSWRFKAPRPVAKWEGLKDATAFGPVCPQAGDVGLRSNEGTALLPTSEDCLVLNVWTPQLDSSRRPVMVWFHGRGFYAGSGSERLYDGARLAARGDVVVVTVNHRLNVFGHLYLGKVGGSAFAASGNAGTADMQLALEWVRDNIGGFGGDRDNVTIFGESGGGAKVSTLLGIPAAKGLFKRGIIESGARLTGVPLATAIRNTETVMAKLNVKTVEELQALPAATLLAAVTTTGRTTPDFGPVTDGGYLPADMFDPVAVASARGIPVIVGTNKDEFALYAGDDPTILRDMTEADLKKNLEPQLGKDVDAAIVAYKQSRPGVTPYDLLIAIRSNRFHISAVRLAESQSKAAPVYLYSFDFDPTGRGAAHGAEISYVFSNATSGAAPRPGAKAVEDAMSAAWIAFARTGSPNHPGIPAWPSYNTTSRPMMVFNATTAVVNDLRSPERKFWEGRTLFR